MSGPNERDEIAAVLLAASEPERATMTRPAPDERVAHFHGYLADAILASDWLAERDRRTAATAVREAADELDRLDGHEAAEQAIRDRADRIEAGQ